MAKKEQNIMLLQEVVGQLRKLNAISVRDRLREAEEAKRAEKIALQGEEQLETEGLVVNAQEDFRRRFVAGQAKTFTDSQLTKTGGKKRDDRRDELLKQIAGIGSESKELAIRDSADSSSTALTSPLTAPLTNNFYEEGVRAITFTIGKTNELLNLLISDNRSWRSDQLKQYNTSQRLARENRLEGIKLGGRGAAGMGIGGMGGVGADDLNQEGFFDEGTMGNIKAAGAASAATAALGLFARFRKWFGFGTKKGFAKTMAQRFRIAGKKLFKGRKLSAKQTGMLKNPRLWPLITAGLLVASFTGAANDLSEPEVDIDLSEDDGGIMGTGIDGGTLLNTALWASLLTPNKLKTKIATAMKTATTAAFSKAKPGTLRARMWATRMMPKSPFSLMKGGLRFLGPLGLAAWATWTFVSWRLSENEKALEAAEQSMAEIRAIDSEDAFQDFMANDKRFNDFKFKGDAGVPGGFAGQNGQKKRRNAQIMESVKQLYMNRSLAEREFITRGLIENGNWSADELKKVQVMADNQMRNDVLAARYGTSDFGQNTSGRSGGVGNKGGLVDKLKLEEAEKLRLEEAERIRLLGDGPHGGQIVIAGNGDTYQNSATHYYVVGAHDNSVNRKNGFAYSGLSHTY